MQARSVKITLAALIVIALTLVVSPKIIGSSIERATIDNLIALIPPESASQLEIRRNEFDNGWFSSSAIIEVIYTPLGTDSVSLLMDFTIDHGPLLQTTDGLRIGLAFANIQPSLRNELFDLAIADFPFPLPDVSLNLFARFNQSLRLGMNITALDYAGSDGEVKFEGLSASFNVNQDQSANFSLDMGELSATENSANSNIAISGVSLHSVTEQMNDILADSNAELSIPSIGSTAPLPFTVSDILIEYGLRSSATSSENIEAYQNISVADIDGDLPIRSLTWNSEVKQLDGELIRNYYQLLSDLQKEMNSNPNAVTAELSELGQELLLLSLQNTLELNNFLRANAFDGEHSADLRVQWAGLADLNNVAELDLNAALAALTLVLDVSLDLEAILRSPLAEMVDPYVQQGYLTVNNGRLLIQASLEDSVLRVNGDELPLDQFF